MSLIVDVRTDGRTFLTGLLRHLSGDDLKMRPGPKQATAVYSWRATSETERWHTRVSLSLQYLYSKSTTVQLSQT